MIGSVVSEGILFWESRCSFPDDSNGLFFGFLGSTFGLFLVASSPFLWFLWLSSIYLTLNYGEERAASSLQLCWCTGSDIKRSYRRINNEHLPEEPVKSETWFMSNHLLDYIINIFGIHSDFIEFTNKKSIFIFNILLVLQHTAWNSDNILKLILKTYWNWEIFWVESLAFDNLKLFERELFSFEPSFLFFLLLLLSRLWYVRSRSILYIAPRIPDNTFL